MTYAAQPPSRLSSTAFAWVVTGVYLLVAVPRVLMHEMWRDEWQTWMLCSASDSLSELMFNRRYDGHPLLWYLLVWPLTKLTINPFAMKLLHVALASAAVWVMARWAPFSRLQRALIAGGYFLLFEYATISRNYAAGVLLLFAFCALYAGEHRRLWLSAIMLGLLAQTSAFGTLLAMTLAGVVLLDALLKRERIIAAAGAFAVVAAAAMTAIWSLIPPGPSSLNPPIKLQLDGPRAVHTLAVVWQAMAPMPRLQEQFWNTNILDPDLPSTASLMVVRDMTNAGPQIVLQAVLGAAVAVLVGVSLHRRPAVLAGWVVGVLVVLGFVYAKYFGFLRHHGHLWLLFLALLWIAPVCKRFNSDWSTQAQRLGKYGMVALLVVHVLGAAWVTTVHLPFSGSRAAAEYIRQKFPADVLVAGDPHYVASSVAGCLGRELFYPATHDFGTYVVWDETPPLDYPIVQQRTLALARERKQPVLLLTNYYLPDPDRRFQQMEVFDQSVVPDEVYVLYRVNPE